MASVIDTVPWVAHLARYRLVILAGSAGVLALNYWLVVVRPRACAPGELCHMDSPFMRFNRRLYWISIALFSVAVTVTYGSQMVVRWLG